MFRLKKRYWHYEEVSALCLYYHDIIYSKCTLIKHLMTSNCRTNSYTLEQVSFSCSLEENVQAEQRVRYTKKQSCYILRSMTSPNGIPYSNKTLYSRSYGYSVHVYYISFIFQSSNLHIIIFDWEKGKIKKILNQHIPVCWYIW